MCSRYLNGDYLGLLFATLLISSSACLNDPPASVTPATPENHSSAYPSCQLCFPPPPRLSAEAGFFFFFLPLDIMDSDQICASATLRKDFWDALGLEGQYFSQYS